VLGGNIGNTREVPDQFLDLFSCGLRA